MKKKYKDLLKCMGKSLICALVVGAAIFVGCKIYFSHFTLNSIQAPLAVKISVTLSGSTALTLWLALSALLLGRAERRSEAIWREENRRMAKDFNSDIKGVNLAGLIDDTQGKEFTTLFGERIRVGEDHGTGYMICKTLAVLSLFFTVIVAVISFFMMRSLL